MSAADARPAAGHLRRRDVVRRPAGAGRRQRAQAGPGHAGDRRCGAAPSRPAAAARRWAASQGGVRVVGGRRRAAPPGQPGRIRERRARALPRLRRHPPAVGAAPERQRRCPQRSPRPSGTAPTASSSSTPIAVGLETCVRIGMAGYERDGEELHLLRARAARDVDLRRDGRSGGGQRHPAGRTGCCTPWRRRPPWRPGSSRRTAPVAPSSGCTAGAAPRRTSPPPSSWRRGSPALRRSSRGGSGSSRRGSTASSTAPRSGAGRLPLARARHLLQPYPRTTSRTPPWTRRPHFASGGSPRSGWSG